MYFDPIKTTFEGLSWLKTVPSDIVLGGLIDLTNGYWHLRLHPALRTKMLFNLEHKTYECIGVPMGWTLAPWAFTRFMRVIVSALRNPRSLYLPRHMLIMQLQIDSIVILIYLDDLLVLIWAGQAGLDILRTVAELYRCLGLSFKTCKSILVPARFVDHLGVTLDFLLKVYALPE